MEDIGKIFTEGKKLHSFKMYGETVLHIYLLQDTYHAIYTSHASDSIIKHEVLNQQKLGLYIKMYSQNAVR